MQPDLTRPGAGEAFDALVTLYTAASAGDDHYLMAMAGYGLADLHHITGGDRDALVTLVRDAAAAAVMVAAGMKRPS